MFHLLEALVVIRLHMVEAVFELLQVKIDFLELACLFALLVFDRAHALLVVGGGGGIRRASGGKRGGGIFIAAVNCAAQGLHLVFKLVDAAQKLRRFIGRLGACPHRDKAGNKQGPCG